MRFLPIGLAVIFCCGCSLYKSPVRRDFEERSPSRVQTLSFQGECKKNGAIPAWIEREFPSRPVELLVADNDLEVRKITLSNGKIVVRSDRPLDDGDFESCHREFSSENEWLANRDSYLSSLGVTPLD